MSDSEDSTVTYTVVSSSFEGLSDIGSLGVKGPPMMPEDPYSYVVASFQALPSPDYMMDEVFPTEEQPMHVAASPATESPGYVDESDPDEDLEKDPEEDPVDYPVDKGDDDDESSDDDEDDDVEENEDEEEEEHLAPADSTTVALPAVNHAQSAEEIELFETDESVATPPPHRAYHVTARMSIRPQKPISFLLDTDIARLMAIPIPPPSPLSLWSSPLPQIPSPPLSLPLPLPTSPTYLLGYRVAMIRLRAEEPSTTITIHLPFNTTIKDTTTLTYTISYSITTFASSLY
nr:hypothetical protein [Tanacetum cinerariifolium]